MEKQLFAVFVTAMLLAATAAAQTGPDTPKTEPKAAQASDIEAVRKDLEEVKKQVTMLVQQGQPTPEATYDKLVASYRGYWDAAKKTSEYRACKASGGKPVPQVTNGQGSIVCGKR